MRNAKSGKMQSLPSRFHDAVGEIAIYFRAAHSSKLYTVTGTFTCVCTFILSDQKVSLNCTYLPLFCVMHSDTVSFVSVSTQFHVFRNADICFMTY